MKKILSNNVKQLLNFLDLHRLILQKGMIKLKSSFKTVNLNIQSGNEKPASNFIFDNEIDLILNKSLTELKNNNDEVYLDKDNKFIRTSIDKLEKQILNMAAGKQSESNIIEVIRNFKLSTIEINIIGMCLLPEYDENYNKIFGYLNNNLNKQNPTVGILIKFLSGNKEEKIDLRKYFTEDSALFRYNLIEYAEQFDNKSSLLQKQIKLNQRIVQYVFNNDMINNKIIKYIDEYNQNDSFDSLYLKKETKDFFKNWTGKDNIVENSSNTVFSFFGYDSMSKIITAGIISSKLRKSLLIIDFESLPLSAELFKDLFGSIIRESILLSKILYFKNVNSLIDNDKTSIETKKTVINYINNCQHLLFISSDKEIYSIKGKIYSKQYIEIEFAVPDFKMREQIWNSLLENKYKLADDVNINKIADRFKMTYLQIQQAVISARDISSSRINNNNIITMDDLYQGCKSQSNQKLKELAQKIIPKYTWSDIVLPEDQMNQLKEITDYVKFKNVVYNDWGFDRKLSLGRGLNVLFSGQSGTGKTMAAEIMCNTLNLDLYKIDLSTVVSKYIGETEKNLSRIFQEAEMSNVILFFDEADALFGKRSEVKDAHDRYANIEIGYLLQKMEEYTGVVILATNKRMNMDDAFIRRMHFTVEFPFPDEVNRLKIWKNVFPEKTPIDKEIDFEFMAKKFQFSGGNIKNIALQSAFYAVSKDRNVCTIDLIKASKREFQKMGKICVKSDFGDYYEFL